MEDFELIKIADKAKENSYSPYSNFKVGACVLTEKGNIFTGCNIENISFGASICAERTAIFKAISEGEKNFKKIAVMSSSKNFTYPCGMCIQVLFEFMPDGELIVSNSDGKTEKYKIKDLMPYQFNENLKKY